MVGAASIDGEPQFGPHNGYTFKFGVLVKVTITVMNHAGQEASWEEGVYWAYDHCHHQWKSRQELKQARGLEVGADAEDMEKCCLLACFLGLPTQDSTTHNGLGPHSQAWLQMHLMEAFS